MLRPWRAVPAVALATLVMATPAAWFQGGPGLLGFGVATLTAGLLHLGWRQALRRHHSSTTNHKEVRS